MTMLDLSAIGLQIILPLALIAWLAFGPVGGRFGFALQALGTALVLVMLLLVAVWMIPPWWTPYVYLALFVLAFVSRLGAVVRSDRWLPQYWTGWIGPLLLGAFGFWSATLIVEALQGRNLPVNIDAVDLEFPMGPGIYLVASGGAADRINGHFLTLNPKTERQRAYRGQSFAVDLIKIDDWGFRASGWRPVDPAAYAIFGEPVYAPCDGKVLRAEGGMRDMPVPETDRSRLEGNHVILQCGDVAVLLAHFRQGSVRVAAGDMVQAGDRLGAAGNSGQSTEPHLHIHVQHIPPEGPLLSGEPVYLTFGDQFPVRNDRIVIGH
jgi:hypothetical protein